MIGELITLLITSVLLNNAVLNQFLGLCPFMGVSRKKSSALGMGVAVVFVIVAAGIVTYGLYHLVLSSPALYKSLGVYLPLITTNCVVLNVCLVNISNGYDIAHMLVYTIGTPLGFALVLYIFSCIRERLEVADVPQCFKGNPIALIVAGLMAMAFSGLAGII